MNTPVKIIQPFDQLVSPMPADKTAMGTMPTAGFQYCEALTSATSYGYHVFPPMGAVLRSKSGYIELLDDGEWIPLETLAMPSECQVKWSKIAPDNFKDRLPPFLQRFFVPDVVQVFTGLFVVCSPGWSILIRPIVNVIQDSRVMFYEGIVEADIFHPVPLFINIRFTQKNTPFAFEKYRPLFQIQPIMQGCYTKSNILVEKIEGEDGVNNFPWQGLNRTTRIFHGSDGDLTLGDYKKEVRRRRRLKSAEDTDG